MEATNKPKAFKLIGFIALASTAILLGSCASVESPGAKAENTSGVLIKVDGSSTVFPITDEIAKEFQTSVAKPPQISVSISGTGGGFKKFCAAETDITNASRPILQEEMAACKAAGVQYIELPIAYDALTVVVHPQNNWANDITIAELKKIWEPEAEGKITTWNQIRSNWPNQPLTLYGAGKDSGTFDYFTEAAVGEAKASRNDYTATEDDTVIVKGVSQDPNALGYFGYSYYEENKTKLKTLAIDSNGKPIPPSRDTVKNGEYQPFSRPLFIYVNAKSTEKPEVREFVTYYLTNARQVVNTVGYVPLPDEIYQTALTHLEQKKVGTVFAGKSELNLKIEDLLKKEAEF